MKILACHMYNLFPGVLNMAEDLVKMKMAEAKYFLSYCCTGLILKPQNVPHEMKNVGWFAESL